MTDSQDLAKVRHLFPDRPVIDAEIVSDADIARLKTERGRAEFRRDGYVSDARWAVRATGRAVTHERTKAVARQVAYIPGGLRVVGRFMWEHWTTAGYARAIREANARGEFDREVELRREAEAAKQARFVRIMAYIRAPQELLKAALTILAGLVGLLILLGMALWAVTGDPANVVGPLRFVMWLIAGVALVFTVGGPLLLAGLGGLAILGLWAAGRRAGEVPDILAAKPAGAPTTREVIPDEGAILEALKNLNLPPLNKKFKEGWRPRWPLPTGLDGKGYRTQLELPPGVNVKMINERKELLAHNLVRLPVEVWPTEPQDQPGVLDLWVAHQGLLTGPVPPYPLLTAGTCDYFRGVPVGFDQRGDVVTARLMACNYAIGGTMGSGKTSLVIDMVTGAALDPLVDIDVYVMAHNVDYDPFKPRLSTLVKGDEDEHITAAMDGLRDLREEVTQRGKLLAELGGEETKVTRALAKKDARMRPKLVVYDECQELFRHEKYGEQAKQLAIKVMTKARKCAITLLWVTPEPSADSLPRELAKIVSHGVCFAIGDYQGNDAILGTGAYKRGISAVDLDPQANIGTAMAFGFGSRPGLLRTCYIRKDATADELTPIVRRSLAPWRGAQAEMPAEERDLLDDVLELIGDQKTASAADVARWLRGRWTDYTPYGSLTGVQLTDQLGVLGAEVTQLHGVWTVYRDRVKTARK